MFGKTLPLNEKVRAAGAFGGIALASVVALDLLVTTGLQIDPPSSVPNSIEPDPTFVEVTDGGWRSDYSYKAVSWAEPIAIDDPAYQPAQIERLAGAPDGRDPSYSTAHYEVPSEDDLYREIAALYAEQDARAAEARDISAAEAEAQLYEELSTVNGSERGF
ncbi:MAG: hypothetical protein H7124_11520 [Phycisphaerales bacterium]|nr:hypothetical protein [Hyphomonadaceae bacterium]